MNDEYQLGFQIDMTDEEVRTLLYAVQEALRVWPGYPARPVEEQESLQGLRDTLFAMTLEINLDL
jgi:hypothetical protein